MKLINFILNDRMYESSLWLLGSSVIMTLFGFFFWTLNARLFSPDEVGIASTLISSAELIVLLSLLGLDVTVMRYVGNYKNNSSLFNTSLSLSALISLLLGIVFIFVIGLIIPGLGRLKDHWLLFLFPVFVVFSLLNRLLSVILISLRKTQIVFIMSVIFSVLKLVMLLLLISMGAFAILGSWMAAMVIVFFLSLTFVEWKLKFQIDRNVIRDVFRFSSFSYFSNFLSMAPEAILPLMITYMIDPSTTAYFYISWMIAAVLFFIPASISKVLLVEGSIDEKTLNDGIKKSIRFIFLLLIPAVITLVISSKYLLLLFGKEYSEQAFRLLQILALSSIPYSINSIYTSIKNVEHRINAVLAINFVIAAFTIGLSYILIDYGILMVGVTWLFIQLIVSIGPSISIIRRLRSAG